MPDKGTGLKWDGSDLMSVAVASGRLLRKAMHSDGDCEVKRLVDAGLLETLWLPKKQDHANWPQKDLVRSDLAKLAEPHPDITPVDQQLKTERCDFLYNKSCPGCDAGSLLARVLLGPMDWFFESELASGNENGLLWVVAKLYDQFAESNFFRTLSILDRTDDDYRAGQLLIRLPEQNYDWFKTHVADFSSLLREIERLEEVDYCLVCNKKLYNSPEAENLKATKLHVYDISSLMDVVAKHMDGQYPELRRELIDLNKPDNSKRLASEILSPATAEHLRQYIANTNNASLGAVNLHMKEEKTVIGLFEKCFFNSNRQLTDTLKVPLQSLLGKVKKQTGVDLLDVTDLERLANYFIWLHLLHPGLGSYTVRYASSYQVSPSGEVRKNMQNPCFVLASRMLPSVETVSASRLALTHIMGPLEDYYVKQWALQAGARKQGRQMGEFFGVAQHHDMGNLETKTRGIVVDLLEYWNDMSDKEKLSDLRRLRSHIALAFLGTGIESLWSGKKETESLSSIKTDLEKVVDFGEQQVQITGEWSDLVEVPKELRIVFANLIGNALKARSNTITIESVPQNRAYRFVVANDIVMPRSTLKKATATPRPDAVPDQKRGLWICRYIIEEICGGTWSIATGKKGTCIRVTTPRRGKNTDERG